MISIESETDQLYRALEFMNREALARAVAHSLNATADAVRSAAVVNVKKALTVRVPYTLKSIVQDRSARGNIAAKMFARVGSRSPYLPIHDEGGTIDAKERRIPIPVLSARGGALSAPILQKYRMNVLGVLKGNKQFFAGKPKGDRFKLLGIYERRGKTLLPIRHLEASRVQVPRTNWWTEANAKYGTARVVQARFNEQAKAEIAGIKQRFGL